MLAVYSKNRDKDRHCYCGRECKEDCMYVKGLFCLILESITHCLCRHRTKYKKARIRTSESNDYMDVDIDGKVVVIDLDTEYDNDV